MIHGGKYIACRGCRAHGQVIVKRFIGTETVGVGAGSSASKNGRIKDTPGRLDTAFINNYPRFTSALLSLPTYFYKRELFSWKYPPRR